MPNEFEQAVVEVQGQPLQRERVETLQINLGPICNQACAHCHLSAGPHRAESMSPRAVEAVIETARRSACTVADITGGAPELHPSFRDLVRGLCPLVEQVIVRTNLTALLEPGLEDLPEFFRRHRVTLVASMPCYMEENVRSQRGPHVYGKSGEMLRRLNEHGYGRDDDLRLDLVYNPVGTTLPPEQVSLEADYRRELADRLGVAFSNLLTITNVPLGRFARMLRATGQEEAYSRLLRESFNPLTVPHLMCRSQVSVGWDGRLYDCDFNLALGQPIPDAPALPFDLRDLVGRAIVTGAHCFGCTAGHGSSCRGALVAEPVAASPTGP